MTDSPTTPQDKREVQKDTDGRLLFPVSGTTPVNALGASVAHHLRRGEKIRLIAIGAGAVNQMIKGCVAARRNVAGEGRDLTLRPGMRRTHSTKTNEEVESVIMDVLL